MNHLMVDIETLGTRPGSVILSIGAVVFDPRGNSVGPTFYVNVDAKSCGALGMTCDESTVRWWEQPENQKARKRIEKSPKPISITAALTTFMEFYRLYKCDGIWGHGSCFDVVLIEDALRRLGVTVFPWDFRSVRDTRTLFDVSDTLLPRDEKLYPKHEALADAKFQAFSVQHVYRRLSKYSDLNELAGIE